MLRSVVIHTFCVDSELELRPSDAAGHRIHNYQSRPEEQHIILVKELAAHLISDSRGRLENIVITAAVLRFGDLLPDSHGQQYELLNKSGSCLEWKNSPASTIVTLPRWMERSQRSGGWVLVAESRGYLLERCLGANIREQWNTFTRKWRLQIGVTRLERGINLFISCIICLRIYLTS